MRIPLFHPRYLGLSAVGVLCALCALMALVLRNRLDTAIARHRTVQVQVAALERLQEAVGDLEELILTRRHGADPLIDQLAQRSRKSIEASLLTLRAHAGPRSLEALARMEPTLHLLLSNTGSRGLGVGTPEALGPASIHELEGEFRTFLKEKSGELDGLSAALTTLASQAAVAVGATLALGACFILGGIWLLADLHRRYRLAEEEHKAWHRSYFDAANVGIVHGEPSTLRLLEVNDAFCAMVGYSREELLSMTALELDHPEERETDLRWLQAMQSPGGPPFRREKRYRRKDGSTFWAEVSVSPIRDPDGNLKMQTALVLDITDRRDAQETIAEHRALLQHVLDGSDQGYWDLHFPSGAVTTSSRCKELLGIPPEVPLPNLDSWTALIHPQDQPARQDAFDAHIAGASPSFACEARIHHGLTGAWKWMLCRGRIYERDASGRPLRMAGTLMDLSDRKALELGLVRETERYLALFKSLPIPAWMVDRDRKCFVACNEMVESAFGWSEEEFLAFQLTDLIPPELRIASEEALETDRLRVGASGPWPIKCKDGQLRTGMVLSHDLELQGRRGRISVFHDFTDLFTVDQEREQHLSEARDFLYALEQGAMITITDAEGDITYCNEAFAQASGYSLEELLGQNHRLLKSGHHPTEFFSDLWDTIKAGQVWKGEVCNRAKDGHLYWVQMSIVPFLGPFGVPHHFMAVRFDISDRKRAEAELLRTLRELEGLLEAVSVGRLVPFRSDADQGTLILGEAALAVLGVDPTKFQKPGDLDVLLDLEGRTRLKNALALVAPGSPATFQARMEGPEGATLWARWTILQEGGELRGVIQDVTEQQELEARLRQAQKLDSLGTLASGIAHDFNNLLATILGTTEILGEDPDLTQAQRRRVQLAHRAADRGRQLVSKLSTFGRKSAQDWALSDLNHVVHEVATMAGHALPNSIHLLTDLREDLPLTYLDPGQLHQALLNLILNARDALGLEGRITVRTGRGRVVFPERLGNRPGGDFIFIEVADDGPGMSAEVRSRIFEPFFTTKVTGKGTGLGLAVVHGVVQRHHGILELDTEPGRGACFRIFLPFLPTVALMDEDTPPAAPRPLGVLMPEGPDREELIELVHRLGREVRPLDPLRSLEHIHELGSVFIHADLAPSILREYQPLHGSESALSWVALGEDPTRGILSASDLRPVAVLPLRPSLRQMLRVIAIL